jgi:hypothetical protein
VTGADLLDRLVALCKCEVALTANAHRNDYQSVREWLASHDAEVDAETAAEMERTDTVYTLRCYTISPIGAYVFYDSRLDRLLETAVAAVEQERARDR